MGFLQRWSNENEANHAADAADAVQKTNGCKRSFPYWTVGVGIGVIFLAIGDHLNQFERFYRKAIMICLECIGIG